MTDDITVYLKFEENLKVNYILRLNPYTDGILITKDNKIKKAGIHYDIPEPKGTLWVYPNDFVSIKEQKGDVTL